MASTIVKKKSGGGPTHIFLASDKQVHHINLKANVKVVYMNRLYRYINEIFLAKVFSSFPMWLLIKALMSV